MKVVNARNKFRNHKVEWIGKWRGQRVLLHFDSKKELERGIYLIYLEKSGGIRDLEFQKRFVLLPSFRDERQVTYRSDAFYYDIKLNSWVVEDTKSPATKKLQSYIIKRKLVKYQNKDFIFNEF